MLSVFDIILAGCCIAIVCTVQPWHYWHDWLPTTTSVSSPAPPQQSQDHHGQGEEDHFHHHHHHHHEHDHHETNKKMADGKTLVSVDFEVFGIVQGVFFRKFTQETAKKHGLVGWVKNTRTGTVVGVVQGPNDKVELMKNWLKKEGSPKSRIEKAEFNNIRTIDKFKYTDFKIIRKGKGK